ncbi:MAG: PH domain-containing protein [Candidatus Methanomethylophilaceae archaeon]
MSNEFKVDEKGLTSDGYHTLPKRSIWSMYTGNAVAAAVITAIVYGTYVFALLPYDAPSTYVISIFVVYALIVVYLAFGPLVYYARYRYKIDGDRIDIRKGIIIISHTVVPIERVHQLEVARGPINNLFRLADVTITTAGGVARIQYLEIPVAEEIADSLNNYVTEILRKRE